MFYGDPTFGGAAALWNLMKERDLLTFKPLEARQAREAQAQSLRDFHAAERESGGRPRATAPLPQDVQAKIKTGGYDPVVSEEDDMDKYLNMLFLSEIMAGMAGDPAPTPYTVQAGPAAREFTPYNMFS